MRVEEGLEQVNDVRPLPRQPLKKAPPMPQPSAGGRITVLDVGDSIGKDLGMGLADELSGVPGVHLLQNSVGDTGLANLGYYNWLTQLPIEVAKYHPQVVIIMLGGNDAQPFQNGNAVVHLGTPAWRSHLPATSRHY